MKGHRGLAGSLSPTTAAATLFHSCGVPSPDSLRTEAELGHPSPPLCLLSDWPCDSGPVT